MSFSGRVRTLKNACIELILRAKEIQLNPDEAWEVVIIGRREKIIRNLNKWYLFYFLINTLHILIKIIRRDVGLNTRFSKQPNQRLVRVCITIHVSESTRASILSQLWETNLRWTAGEKLLEQCKKRIGSS